MPAALDRLTWPTDRLAAHRTVELRRLLRMAREASPWHRDRIAGIDIDAVEESDLSAPPVMTKDDLMANFDAAVTPRAAAARRRREAPGRADRGRLPVRPLPRVRLRRLVRAPRRGGLRLGRLGNSVPAPQPPPSPGAPDRPGPRWGTAVGGSRDGRAAPLQRGDRGDAPDLGHAVGVAVRHPNLSSSSARQVLGSRPVARRLDRHPRSLADWHVVRAVLGVPVVLCQET